MTDRWQDRAACRDHDREMWFPTLTGPDNHGAAAKHICAACPVNRPCLVNSLIANEKWGILGGAGEDERRWLRREWHTDGPDGPVWTAAESEHFARLHGTRTPPVDRNGPGVSHGRSVTYSRACRCTVCTFAASMRGAGAKRDRAWRHRRAA